MPRHTVEPFIHILQYQVILHVTSEMVNRSLPVEPEYRNLVHHGNSPMQTLGLYKLYCQAVDNLPRLPDGQQVKRIEAAPARNSESIPNNNSVLIPNNNSVSLPRRKL